MSTRKSVVITDRLVIDCISWVARARSDDTARLGGIYVDSEPDKIRGRQIIVATDGRRLHRALLPAHTLPVGSWDIEETKKQIVLTESEYTFPNWRRVIPTEPPEIGKYEAFTYSGKRAPNAARFSAELFKLFRDTTACFNIRYLHDIGEKDGLMYTVSGAEPTKAFVFAVSQYPADQFAVIMPMEAQS